METPETTPTAPPNLEGPKPEPTWFFRRGDGHTFAAGEVEAHAILRNRTEWMRRDFELLGHSDGQTYFRIIREADGEAQKLRAERARLAQDAARYRKTEDRLKFEELKPEDDEQVAKVRAILESLDLQIAEIDAQLASWAKIVTDRAFQAELEVARGNMVLPRNMDIATPVDRDREKIVSNLPRR